MARPGTTRKKNGQNEFDPASRILRDCNGNEMETDVRRDSGKLKSKADGKCDQQNDREARALEDRGAGYEIESVRYFLLSVRQLGFLDVERRGLFREKPRPGDGQRNGGAKNQGAEYDQRQAGIEEERRKHFQPSVRRRQDISGVEILETERPLKRGRQRPGRGVHPPMKMDHY